MICAQMSTIVVPKFILNVVMKLVLWLNWIGTRRPIRFVYSSPQTNCIINVLLPNDVYLLTVFIANRTCVWTYVSN